jgi:hypothetical protein
LPQFSWDLLMPLPAPSRAILAADAVWPGTGRTAWIRASNAWKDPRSASTDIAAAMSAARARRSASRTASPSTAALACVPLISASPSLGPSATGRRPARARATAARLARALVLGFAFADEDERDVRERGEVAAGADRAPRGHDGMHTGVQQCDEHVERLDPDAGVSLREHVRAQRHDRAHDRRRQRFADARGVAPQQIQLEAIELVGRNRDVGQRAESGVDSVHSVAGRRMRVDHRARPAHTVTRRRRDVHVFAVSRDLGKRLERERGPIECDHSRLRCGPIPVVPVVPVAPVIPVVRVIPVVPVVSSVGEGIILPT